LYPCIDIGIKFICASNTIPTLHPDSNTTQIQCAEEFSSLTKRFTSNLAKKIVYWAVLILKDIPCQVRVSEPIVHQEIHFREREYYSEEAIKKPTQITTNFCGKYMIWENLSDSFFSLWGDLSYLSYLPSYT